MHDRRSRPRTVVRSSTVQSRNRLPRAELEASVHPVCVPSRAAAATSRSQSSPSVRIAGMDVAVAKRWTRPRGRPRSGRRSAWMEQFFDLRGRREIARERIAPPARGARAARGRRRWLETLDAGTGPARALLSPAASRIALICRTASRRPVVRETIAPDVGRTGQPAAR